MAGLRGAWALAGVLAGLAAGALAQSGDPMRAKSALALPAGALSAETGSILAEMASQAGVIFTGEVVGVTRSAERGFVDVRFRIAQAVRGCPASGFYVMREWIGLWAAHPDRFREGERLLMLLTARGPAGMSSPVGGMDGAIPLISSGAGPVTSATGVAPADTAGASASMVDLRWIGTRVERAVASTTPATTTLAQARAAEQSEWAGPVAPLMPGSLPARAAGLGAVLAALGGSAGGTNYAR